MRSRFCAATSLGFNADRTHTFLTKEPSYGPLFNLFQNACKCGQICLSASESYDMFDMIQTPDKSKLHVCVAPHAKRAVAALHVLKHHKWDVSV
jgi:hypothetical protein